MLPKQATSTPVIDAEFTKGGKETLQVCVGYGDPLTIGVTHTFDGSTLPFAEVKVTVFAVVENVAGAGLPFKSQPLLLPNSQL